MVTLTFLQHWPNLEKCSSTDLLHYVSLHSSPAKLLFEAPFMLALTAIPHRSVPAQNLPLHTDALGENATQCTPSMDPG